MDIPVDQIESTRIIIGERCRVESQTVRPRNAELGIDDMRTLTVTTEAGIICVFKGVMDFTWVLPPDA